MKNIKYIKDDVSIDIRFSIEENTIWMNQKEMAILFGISNKTVSYYMTKMRDYFEQNASVVSKIETTAKDGKSYKMSYYNLDVIEMVGNMIDPVFTKEFVSWCKEQLDKERNQIMPIQSNIIRFEQGDVIIDVNVDPKEGTVYLNKDQIVTLFGTTRQTIEYHIENIYESGELEKGATCKEILQVQTEGSRKVTRSYILYNLDLIISIGFRVNSKLGIVFRSWARKILKQYSVEGYSIDKRRIEVLEANYTYMHKDIEDVKATVNHIQKVIKEEKKIQKIFYKGSAFDAYDLLCKLINEADKSIIIIDPYIDEIALSILKNKKKGVKINIITTSKCQISTTDINKFSLQYGDIDIRRVNDFHDRFLILDKEKIYVLGNSINRIGHHISTIIDLEDKMFIDYINNLITNNI